MAGETILVIDAGQDVDEKMTTALEAEGYLAYAVSRQDVNAQLAELLKPSLMYIRPPDLRPTGLDPCKAIHGIPLLMKVPVVILVSLKKPPGPQYLEEYGIVDFLEPTFSVEELVEKTGTILGKTLFSQPPPKREEPTASRPVMKTEKKRSSLLLPAAGIMVILAIAGAGYVAYQQFMPSQKGPPSAAVKVPRRVASVAPKAELKPQFPPGTNVAESPATTPATTPATPPANTPVNTPANPPVPASSVSPTPPVQPSSASSENAPQPTAKPFYSVQLGAFRDEEMAAALTRKFKERGYDAFTQPGVTKDKAPIYRVLVNKYEDRKAAQKMAGEIQTREQVKTTLYSD